MLIRLFLLLATLLQAAVVSTGAAHARVQHPTFTAPICKNDASPANPYSPTDRAGSCVDCVSCCNSHPPDLCVFELVSRLIRPTGQSVILTPAVLPAPPKHSESPPARGPPA
ncbi:hypothetical protein [Methylocystis sp.]|uniref:hypothetical protein n=1 Tax=Methylocystis sp. TaxID=1911079 RepID=UPI003D1421F6